ncbi:MAG TPA: hypothetical protein PK280_11470 [Planctomycetota bacterium]|nr:hypothetical protein [Planctomycetota bacterium]
MRALLMPLVLATLIGGAGQAGEAAPTFTTKPTASKTGDRVKITFAVSAPTDVAVYIEDAKGKVVRHLVAGVLGQNPPPPLKAGLSQEIEWDGLADYGALPPSTIHPPPFRVRVALGLGARYDKVLSRRPPKFSGSTALGAGPDGALYVRHSDFPSIWAHSQLVALNRDGSYRRTLMPYAATPDNREAKGMNVVELNGAQVPVFGSEKGPFAHLSTGMAGPGSGFAVSRDGRLLYVPAPGGIMCVNTAGGFVSPLVAPLEKGGVGANPFFTTTASLATSTDGKGLFLSGVVEAPGKPVLSAILRVNVPERTGQKVFFGDPKTPGSDQAHLGANPGGVASDGRGSLLVADTANNRVVVLDEADGKFRGELKTEKPLLVGAAAGSGALYVASHSKVGLRLAKFSAPAAGAGPGPVAWPDAKPAGELMVPMRTDITQAMAVDASAEPVVIWMSASIMGSLFRIEDRGGKFESVSLSDGRGKTEEGYLGVVVDRRTKEVYVRNGNFGGIWERFDDETGKSELFSIPVKGGGGTGPQLVPAPNGNLYGLQWRFQFYQFDRNGKTVPFSDPRKPTDEEMRLNFPTAYKGMNNDIAKWGSPPQAYVPVAMCELPHCLGARWSDGHLFVIEPYLYSGDRVTPGESCGGRIMKALHEYLPSGKRVTTPANPLVWKLSDAAVGPKFDAAGNIYVADIVRPRGWAYPPELQARLGKAAPEQVLAGEAATVAANYGSIVKFGPKGGMIHYATSGWGAATGPDPFDGQPKFAPGLKEIEADLFYRCLKPVKITGAEWVHPGVGHIGLYGCNCENMTFDVDEFGRTFFPDFCLYQIRVIDTAGNALTRFGGYGNPENCGPDSPVIDPKTGALRARRPDDPKDLKSPFAEPEIAVAWPVGVGVTDRHAYIGDTMNRRMLRVKLTYAAEESCEVK